MVVPKPMPGGVEAHVRPNSFVDGQPITIEVAGATHLASRTVIVAVMGANAVETELILQTALELDENGNGRLDLLDGLHLDHEASLYVHGLIAAEEGTAAQAYNFQNVHVSIANSAMPIVSPAEADTAHARIMAEQESTYVLPLGDRAQPGAIEHRVLAVVQGLYMTRPMRLPGVDIRPIQVRVTAAEEREIINALLAELGWASRIREDIWRSEYQARNH